MSQLAPYGGGTYIADKSAWMRARDPAVASAWTAAMLMDQIATCEVVTLELLYSARDAVEFADLETELAALRQIAVTRSVCSAAVGAMRELSTVAAGFHRVSIPDVIIAAAAQDAGVGVLHYDAHYDRLAQVLHFDSRWIAPAGTL